MPPTQDFVIIFGPPAVGKMTVAYALSERTGFPVFHNHMSIEMVLPFFEYGSPPFKRLSESYRAQLFEEVAQSELPGFIFTFVWAVELESEREYADQIRARFESRGWRIHYVELAASMEARLHRNQTELRLSRKPSMRDVEASTERLQKLSKQYKLNTDGDFFYPDHHLKLETTEMSAEEAARRIVERFGFRS